MACNSLLLSFERANSDIISKARLPASFHFIDKEVLSPKSRHSQNLERALIEYTYNYRFERTTVSLHILTTTWITSLKRSGLGEGQGLRSSFSSFSIRTSQNAANEESLGVFSSPHVRLSDLADDLRRLLQRLEHLRGLLPPQPDVLRLG